MNATLLLPYPPSTNRIWRVARGKVIKSSEYRAWLIEGAAMLARQKHPKFTTTVCVDMAVGMPRRKDGSLSVRKMDLDNRIKPSLDLLQASGVLEDDSLVHRLNVWWSTDVTGIQVDIYPMATEAA